MTSTSKNVELKGRSLMIGIPAYDSKVDIDSMVNIVQLATMTGQHGIELQIAHVSGSSILPKARNTLIARFMQSGCTDFLFLDTDVIFKAEYILRLMAVATNKDIVGGIYPKKNNDGMLAVNLMYSETGTPIVENEFNLYEAVHVPTGFMLIRRHVIEKMIQSYPELMYADKEQQLVCYALFDFQLKDGNYWGEDYTFCHRAIEQGFRIFVDPLLNLGHKMQIESKRQLIPDIYDQQIARNISYLKAAAAKEKY